MNNGGPRRPSLAVLSFAGSSPNAIATTTSNNDDGTTSTGTVGKVSHSSRQHSDKGSATRRSSLIIATTDVLACNYSDPSSATNLQVASQATLSRPSIPSSPSLQQLLEKSKLRNRSGTLASLSPNLGTVQQTHESETSANRAARRHTLAGTTAPAYNILSPLSLRSISSTLNAVRLSRVQISSTKLSSHTSTPVAPVPSRTRSDSTAQRIFVPNLAVSERATSDHPHIQAQHPSPIESSAPPVHDTADTPSPAIDIPRPQEDQTQTVPLTGHFRDGLPADHDHLIETPRRRLRRQLLLPYYTRNRTTSRSASIAGSNKSSNSASSKSSHGDLPTGTLSPLLLARSKTDDPCARDGHRRCPSSPSKQRLRHQRSRRLLSFSVEHQEQYAPYHMRTSSAGSSLGYMPTSPLSPGRTRNSTAAMQPSRNPNARARKPPQEFSLPIPRFHPAMYQSPSNSNASTAASSPRNIRSPGRLAPPMSPRAQQRQLGEARHALMEMHKEINRTAGASGSAATQKPPEGPSLLPACSPGEATPLTLEDAPGDYLTAGAARRGQHADANSQRDMVERMIRDEEERRKGNSNIPSSAPVSPAAGP